MHLLLPCLAALIVDVTCAPVTTDPIVDLGYAKYRGLRNESTGVTGYLGLPFAANPTGPRRWQPPVPIESVMTVNRSSGIIDATAYGLQCVQYYPAWVAGLTAFLDTEAPTAPRMSGEDCLILDVLVPNAPSSKSLPVVIQIHGGGYTLGSSSSYDGTSLVSFSKGQIIYVQIQYRLGPAGFLSSAEVKANGTANAGLLDQRAALEWVQRHIKAFGGDPSRVTITGGSAGGGSVTNQLILYGGVEEPPFRASIPEYPWWQPYHPDDILEAQYQELLQASGCADLGCLRALDGVALANASQATFITGYLADHYGYGDFYYGPSVDGHIVRDLPSKEFEAGHFCKIPMLIDHDGYEGVIFSNFSISSEAQVQPDLQQLWPAATPSFLNQVLSLYPLSDFTGSFLSDPILSLYSSIVPSIQNDSAFYQRASIFGDFIINCPTRYMASAVSSFNLPVYKMRFAAGNALHGATAAFLFSDSSSSGNATLADYMKAWFIGFIAEMNPNANLGFATDRPGWPIYQAMRGKVAGPLMLDVNQTSVSVNADLDDGPRCAFFGSNGNIVRN